MSHDTGYVTAEGFSVEVVNQSGVASADLDPYLREVASRLGDWRSSQSGGRGNMFNRAKFVAPTNPYQQMRMARDAVASDDVVGAAADVTEGLVVQEVRWESSNQDVADIFNEMAGILDLDTYLRTVYRELFTYSQSVSAAWWGMHEYHPKTRTKAARRKQFKLFTPTRLITLDPLKVVPVGMSVFGEDRLAWNATADERDMYLQMLSGPDVKYDAVMEELFVGPYSPRRDEEGELTSLGVNSQTLIEFRPERVWRHAVTKAAYDRFPDNRLRSVFDLLDLKHQLRESDRVTLVGAANYILLVKKGSPTRPAEPEELRNLQDNFKVLARLPIIISDDRLTIEILTPSTDFTLISERYDLLDERIVNRLFGIPAGDFDDQSKSRMIGRLLENRRHQMRRSVEKHLVNAVWDHPLNAEVLKPFKADEKPHLAFNPRHVQVDNDAQFTQLVLAARQQGELSRTSFLEFMGHDLEVEAQRRDREAALYPDWKLEVPFNSPTAGDNGGSGGETRPGEPSVISGTRGGRPKGGGSSPRSAGAVTPRTRSGSPSTKK